VDLHGWIKFRYQFIGWRCFAGGRNCCVYFCNEKCSEIKDLVILGLILALAGAMALVFFGLSVLVINVVDWVWPSKDCATILETGSRPKGDV
jgi:hypothetical protein